MLEAQFRVHRINRQNVRYAILTQWLTEEIAISVSDVLLGPKSDTPYNHLKMAILHQTSLAKQPNSTNQTCTEPHLEDPQSFSYAIVMNTETMHAEELEVIPEQPTKSIKPTVHPSNQHRSPATLCAVQMHNKIPQLCSLVTNDEAKHLRTIPIFNT